MEGLLTAAAEFGPLWLLVFAAVFLLWHFGTKLMEVYASKVEAQIKNEAEREKRKREEAQARIEHDREMAEIKGQMAEQMHEANVLMSALKTLMESVVASNEVLHEDLKASQAGSQQMQSDMKDVKQKVDLIYAKEI